MILARRSARSTCFALVACLWSRGDPGRRDGRIYHGANRLDGRSGRVEDGLRSPDHRSRLLEHGLRSLDHRGCCFQNGLRSMDHRGSLFQNGYGCARHRRNHRLESCFNGFQRLLDRLRHRRRRLDDGLHNRRRDIRHLPDDLRSDLGGRSDGRRGRGGHGSHRSGSGGRHRCEHLGGRLGQRLDDLGKRGASALLVVRSRRRQVTEETATRSRGGRSE